MIQEIKLEWTKRLRSGDYEQGKGLLRNKRDQYCCLGILCEMAVEAGVIKKVLDDGNWAYYYGDERDLSVATLPTSVMEWAGPESTAGVFGGGTEDSLVYHNDSGKPFEYIANVIDEKF